MAPVELNGRAVIVTGGGSGLGREMCLALARAGGNAVAAEVNPAHGAELVDTARAEGIDARVHVIATDVSDPDACVATARQVIGRFGRIYGLVNCAGRGYPLEDAAPGARNPRLWEENAKGWVAVTNLNFNGPFFMSRAVIDDMMAHKEGHIVNVTTSFGTMQRPGIMPYGATKAALETLSMAWADELKEHGVRVNVLVPGGAVDTRILPDKPGEGMRAPGFPLLQPQVMGPPIAWLMSDGSKPYTRTRFIASWWDESLQPDEAAKKVAQPAGWAVPEGQSGVENIKR